MIGKKKKKKGKNGIMELKKIKINSTQGCRTYTFK